MFVEGTDEFARFIDDCINAGIIVFEKLEARLHIIAIAGQTLNECILTVKMFGKNSIEYNYNALKLGELDNKFDILAEKMGVHFNELEAFLIEHHLYTDVVQTASTLMKLMQDTISSPCSQSLEIFRDAVRKAPPLQYGYKVISLLEQDSTNPLKVAMAADKLKTSATFNKWKKIIDGVLKTYLNGMFWESDMYGPDKLKSRIKKLHRKMDKWSDAYSESYWPETVRQLVHETQDNCDYVGNGPKARHLEKELSTILTRRSNYNGFPDELWRKQFTNVGFVGIVRKNQNVAISSAKSFDDRPWGPGWWITADVMNSKEKFILVAGYE
uniref:Uncharacterized protein n=1 Tax=Caenorhabditis japonica TaxID=281687 RepID=A0A8R1E5L5_CAEJA